MTDAEQKLWIRLRRKQINGLQFYRQKPIGSYIVDFFCPTAKLVIEVDGGQHLDPQHRSDDQLRDTYLASRGLRVLRFDNRQVLLETESVVEAIAGIPPVPPLPKGGARLVPSSPPATSNNSVPLLNKGKNKLIPAKQVPTATPPFAKGGRGGISRTTAVKVGDTLHGKS